MHLLVRQCLSRLPLHHVTLVILPFLLWRFICSRIRRQGGELGLGNVQQPIWVLVPYPSELVCEVVSR